MTTSALAKWLSGVKEYRSKIASGEFAMPSGSERENMIMVLVCYRDIPNPSRLRVSWELLKASLAAHWVVFAIQFAACCLRDHKWRVTSSCTPDSGSEYFNCVRCGESHTVHYY